MERKGSCLCGDVSISISAEFQLVEYCHCQTCQRATGAPLMAWAGAATDSVRIEGDRLSSFESSPGVERTFCSRCGTSLTIWAAAFPDVMYVSIAALDNAASIEPEVHIWRSHRLPWLDTVDDLPRYLQFKSDGLQE